MSKPRSSRDTAPAGTYVAASVPTCGSRMTSRLPPSARIWACCSNSAEGLELGLVLDVRGDLLVPQRLARASASAGSMAFKT